MNIISSKCRMFVKTARDTIFNSKFSTARSLILGIETSCDDTGCAVVDTEGNILGEALHSQHLIHLANGGIIPPIAQNLHRENIESVVNTAVKNSNYSFRDLSAVAVTVKPGLPLSLTIGMKYGKYLCRLYNKPFIPIHHMEAHALTARMHDKTVEFPFLVLLISGGHCLLAVAQDVGRFFLLGSTRDDAPGEAFDKVARRMKLTNLSEFSKLSGGQAIELAASRAKNPLQFKFTIPLTQYRDCKFSLAGLKTQVRRHLLEEEKKHNVPPDGLIPDVFNLCAGFQLAVTRHICQRVQRAMVYARRKEMIPENSQTLVVSGGAACNNFIARGLQLVCDEMAYKFVRPPPKLCLDNGVMIAWNGVERWRAKLGVLHDYASVEIQKSCPLGTSLIDDVVKENISCRWTKLTQLNYAQNS
ncbi:tRNA N6-adenosine threonylcarbamoyltransferase, mitochondrial [Tribolium castaneum]|uniref:tRNA N6-adenosine threonylcarbamoyltransferase, mitochondrial n=1 Tax=Tribolium castaneum TaxID=7070 RepID=UPI00046C30BD|nr:PREDICTED: probable tRNA N6-adenosine threonylcarbamoyltransferase, mitochondrial [Tribolium castaneum]|eukprot:XP_974817.2 PREDICTED: probable tRNA N6-adenosine threonylcarbamoyltransferase, mitochondrial [Tribolium castaneum]